MPKSKSSKFLINLDLLKPQSNPEKTLVKLLRWLLSTGRYIFIFVEAIVLIAFITRFKLDEDISSKNESIAAQIPYIESLRPIEVLIRQTQLKLSSIDSISRSSPDYVQILKKISDQTPPGVKVSNLNIETNSDIVTVHLTASAQGNNDLSVLVSGLKQDADFSNVNIGSIGFEKGNLIFSVSAQIKIEGKSS